MFQPRNYHFEQFPKFINRRTLDLRISRRLRWPLELGGVLVVGRCLFASAASHLIASLWRYLRL